MKKITTYSGAVYFLDGRKITGGSKRLKDGELLFPPEPIIGKSMMISAPERGYLNPRFEEPGVTTSMVMRIEDVFPFWWGVKQMFLMFRDAWRSRNA